MSHFYSDTLSLSSLMVNRGGESDSKSIIYGVNPSIPICGEARIALFVSNHVNQ